MRKSTSSHYSTRISSTSFTTWMFLRQEDIEVACLSPRFVWIWDGVFFFKIFVFLSTTHFVCFLSRKMILVSLPDSLDTSKVLVSRWCGPSQTFWNMRWEKPWRNQLDWLAWWALIQAWWNLVWVCVILASGKGHPCSSASHQGANVWGELLSCVGSHGRLGLSDVLRQFETISE